MSDVSQDELVARLGRVHQEHTMVGWDFSRLDGRLWAGTPPWDFEADCLAALQRCGTALDLGTGGGERINQLWRRLPAQHRPRLVATEGWPPNLPVAREALAPLGAQVLAYDAEAGERLPLPTGGVDLVMSRHEAFDADELARVLPPGGLFLTQQVDGHDAPELREWFGGAPQYPDARLAVDVERLRRAGFEVLAQDEWSGPMTFADVDALVAYLAMVPWSAPGFRVADHAPTLHRLAARAPLVVTQRRYRITARRGGAAQARRTEEAVHTLAFTELPDDAREMGLTAWTAPGLELAHSLGRRRDATPRMRALFGVACFLPLALTVAGILFTR